MMPDLGISALVPPLRLPGRGRCPSGSMCSVDTATVGREGGKPDVRDVERGQAGEIWYVAIRLQVPGLHASLRVPAHYATGFDDRVAFFRAFASDRRGWQGERTYESVDHDLRLTATHDGHVRLMAQLSNDPDDWSATTVITLDPSEEMTRAPRTG